MKDISYKHELIMIDDLRINNRKNVPVMMLYEDNKVPAYKNKAGQVRLNDAFFPESFLITNVTNGGDAGEDRYVHVYYYDNKQGKTLYQTIHHCTQFAELTGTKAKELIIETMEAQYKNIEHNLKHTFHIGSDPEIFIEDENGECIPAFNFLGGKNDKKNPFSYPACNYNGSIYWDGFQAEFDTYAATCLEQQSESVQSALQELQRLAKAYNPKAKLSNKTVMRVKQQALEEAKQEHVSLGCMPSYNVYGMSGQVVEDPRLLPIRPAGGHIHFGIGKSTHEQVKDIVKTLDAILGVCCVSLFQKYDDPARRQYYGLAGEYRLPPHGLEYRTLSNAWLYHPVIMNFVFDFARKVLIFGQKGFFSKWQASEAETIACINNCDVTLAHEIMERNKDIIIKLFKAAYGSVSKDEKVFEALYKIFYTGMDCIVKDSTNFSDNWRMGASLYNQSDSNPRNFRNNIDRIIAIGKKVA